MWLEKIWVKFQPGMIMNGAFQIECATSQNIFIKFNSFMKNILNKNLDLKGKKSFIESGFKCSNRNGITIDSRIEKIIPTIKLLLEKQAKIIIISHIGRPKGKID